MMASSSSSSLSSGTWKYDVFLSFRGEDTRKSFVDHLYSALEQRGIHTYKDDVTLPRGDSIGLSLMNAIQESQIAVVVFSENYADSSWCLEELEHIMKCRHERGQIVLPVFYNVDPSDVRKRKRKYEEAFSKHGLSEKNYQRLESWKKALLDASNIAGWETKHIANGHEAVGIQIMVGNVLDKLLSVKSNVEENLVGMGPRLQYLESQLQIGSHGVRMIGIWGLGGGGKTTLAYSVYKKIRDDFQGHCFIGNIRVESAKLGLQKQQEKVLSEVLKTEVLVASVLEGRDKIQSMLCRRKVLIVLDDIYDLEQLEELAGSRDWFGGGSRIIITTRDEHLLRTHRVDEVCPVTLLSDDEAIRLFKRHAYQKDNPVEDYDKLSFRVISYVNGLPLALKVLGSFFYDKDKSEWMSALDKLREIPNRKVTDQLKISYDGLEHDEKQIFLDIACFFRSRQKENAMSILETFGFHADIGIKVLKQKALITISSDGFLDMHDLVQEMGHDIVRGEHPNNLEKRSRFWRSQDIEEICSRNATTENNKIEAIRYVKFGYPPSPSKSFTTLVSNLKILRFLDVHTLHRYDEGPTFISNELKYMSWYRYPASPLPESFQPRKLVVLNLHNTLQIELWKGDKHLPCLKELNLTYARSLVKTPNIAGLPCLQKLTLVHCDRLEEIHQSLGHHASLVYLSVCSCKNLIRFPSIFRMEKLEVLYISDCKALLQFPKIEANMDSLVNLHLENVGIEVLPSSVGRYCTNLFFLNLKKCSKLKRIEGNFHALKRLHVAGVNDHMVISFLNFHVGNLEWLRNEICLSFLELECWQSNHLPPSPHSPRFLRKLNLSGCRLKEGIPCGIDELLNLQELHLCGNHFSRLDSLFQLTRLKLLDLNNCINLVELPELPSNLSILKAQDCLSLKAIRDNVHRNCKWLCQVSVTTYGFRGLVGGERLLETILQGKALCMRIELQGLVIPKGSKLCLVKGRRCRLKLPNNWFNEFSGFLFCSSKEFGWYGSVKITIRQEEKLLMGMRDSYDEQVFCEEGDDIHTWMGYVSFGSLSCTAWWDKTTTAIDVSVDLDSPWDRSNITGFGVGLVSKKNQMEETTTTTNNSCADDDYKCKFEILHDSESRFECQFGTID